MAVEKNGARITLPPLHLGEGWSEGNMVGSRSDHETYALVVRSRQFGIGRDWWIRPFKSLRALAVCLTGASALARRHQARNKRPDRGQQPS